MKNSISQGLRLGQKVSKGFRKWLKDKMGKCVNSAKSVMQIFKLTKLTKLTEQIFATYATSASANFVGKESNESTEMYRVKSRIPSCLFRHSLGSNLSRFSLASLICLCMLTVGVGNAWGTETSHTCSGTSGTIVTSKITWAATSATWNSPQCRIAADGTVVFTLTGVNVTKIIMGFSSSSYIGDWSSSGGGSFASNNSTVTWTGTAGAGTLTFTTSSAARLKTIKVTYTDAASCANKVTISAGTPESGGSFSLDKTGLQETCSGLTVTVSDIVAPSGKVFSAITQTGIADGVTIDQSAKTVTYAANKTGTSTINVTFVDKGCTDHNGTNVVSGASTSHEYGPIDPYYEYSTRQILYTKTDLGLAAGRKGTIKGISFQYAYTSALTGTNSVKIYMANTSLTELSTSKYVTSFTEVYSGSYNCSGNDVYNEITLDTPFEYDGIGNLVVIIDDNSNKEESSSCVFKYHTANTTTGAQIYTRAASTNADPTAAATWTGATAVNYRPNTKFCIQEADMTPATVTLKDNDATLTEASAGAGVTLPSRTGCSGYTFAGWTKSWVTAQTSWTTTAPTIIPAGSYTPAGDEDLYPVYTKTEGGGVAFSNYSQVALNGTITDGKYLISTGSYTMAGDGKTGASFTPGTTEATDKEYTITTLGSGVFTIKGPDDKYVGGSSGTATLSFSTSTPSDNNYKWKYNSTGINFQGQTTRYIQANGTTDFRNYAGSGTTTYLYKRIETGGSTTYYISIPNCCTGPATALSITNGTSVTIGNTLSLTSTGGNGGSVTWDVVNGTGTASVAGSTLTPGTAGTVTVKAHQDQNGSTCAQDAEKEVTIVAATVNVTGVTVDPTSKAIVVGETFTITPTVAPNNATNKNVNWTSANSGIASVSSGTVTGVAAGGPVNITCTTVDGSFTASCATTVYGVTIAVEDEDGTPLSGVGKPTISRSGAAVTTAAAGNYVFKEWSVTNATLSGSTSTGTTITLPTGAVTVKAIYRKPINVTWKVGDDNASGGTTQVAYNTKITTLPTKPGDDDLGDCATKFMGWSATNIGSTPAVDAPSDLFDDPSDAGVVALTSDQTYYAVFASVTSAGVDPISITSFAAGDYYLIDYYSDNYYAMSGTGTSKVNQTEVTSIVSYNSTTGQLTITDASSLTAANVYTISGSTSAAKIYNDNSEAWVTTQSSGTSFSTSEGTNVVTKHASAPRFAFTYASIGTSGNRAVLYRYSQSGWCNYAESNMGASGYGTGYMWLVPAGEAAEYGDYVTKCCTQPLAPTVTVTPAGTTATVTWTKVTGNDGYQLKVEGSSSHNDWTNASSGATVTGLTANGTEYTACVRAKGNTGSGYCDYGAEGCQDFETTCTEYSFHTGSSADDATLKTTNTRTCFAAHPSDANQRIIENYVIPADTRFFVGKFGYFYNSDLNISSNGSQSVIKTFGAANADNGLYFNYTKGYGDGYRPGVGQATGAVGTLYIDVTSTWHNLHVGFDPAGYIFKLGSAYYTMSNSATLNATRYKESEILTLTSTDISGTFQVNIAAVAPNASTGVASAYTESKNLTTMRVKTGSGDSYRGTNINDAADANTRGFFRIDVGEGNSTNWAAHWVPCYRVTYNGNGASGSTDPSADVSCEGNDAARTVQAAANGFTAPTGKQFGGWATSPLNATAGIVAYAAGADVILTGNRTLYAIWSDANYTVTINQNPNVSATTTGQTSSAHSGNTINLTTTVPDGYRFENWTSSDVVITNNTSATTASFTMPASNVTVTANFVQTHTVTWKVSGSADNEVVYDHGDALVLPTPDPSAPSACSEKRFVGWKEGAIDGSTDTPPTLLNPSSLGTVTADKTYYAVFADEGESTTYTKVTDPASLRAGDKIVIICNSTNYGLRINNNTPVNSASTYADASTITPASDMVWTLAGNNTDGFTLSTASRTNDGAVTLGSSSDPGNNSSATLILNNNYNTWKFSAHTTSNCLLITRSNSNNRGMEYYNSGWKVYNNSGVSSNAACAMRVYRKNLSGYVTTCSECVTPSDLEISDITSTGATVTWDGVSQTQQVGGSGTGYKVAWNTSNSVPSPLTASNSADVANGTNTYDITGLTAATQYYVFVQSKCDDSWSSSVNFHTNAKITYAANGGTGDPMPAKEVVYNAASTVVDACTFTAPSGKKFNGWVSSAAVTVNSGVTPTTAVPGGATINNLTQAITLTAQWRDLASYTVNFSADNGTVAGGTSTTVYEDGTLTFPNVSSTTCGVFQGWVEAAYDNATKPSGATFHEAGDEIDVVAEMDDKTYYAVYRVATGVAQTLTDNLVPGDFNATSTTYVATNNLVKTSAATYEAVTANGYSSIQINNISDGRGIVSKISGGVFKGITLTTNTNHSASRKVYVYGSESYTAAYADPAAFNTNSSVRGTLLATLEGDTKSYNTSTDDYEYIAIFANGAGYLDQISLTWYGSPSVYQTSPSCSPTITLTQSLTSFTYVYDAGPSASQSFTVSGMNLGANSLVVTAPTNYEVCKTADGTYTSSVSFTPSDGTVANSTVYIRLAAGLNVGTYNYAAGSGLQVTSTGATTRTAALNGSVTKATGSIAFTDFNAVDHYEAEWTGSAILVPYNYIKTGDGALTTEKVGGRGGAVDTENKKWSLTNEGTYTLRLTLGNGTNYTGAGPVTADFVIYKADRFYDNLHGNDMILKRNDAGEDHYTIPTLTDESRLTSGSCSETHYHFMGWVPESALSTLSNDAAYDAVMITGGGTQAASGTNYYAVWAEE